MADKFELVKEEKKMEKKAIDKTQPKFAVGDRLKVVSNERFQWWHGGYVDIFREIGEGKIVVVKSVNPQEGTFNVAAGYRFSRDVQRNGNGYIYDERCFKRVRKAPKAKEAGVGADKPVKAVPKPIKASPKPVAKAIEREEPKRDPLIPKDGFAVGEAVVCVIEYLPFFIKGKTYKIVGKYREGQGYDNQSIGNRFVAKISSENGNIDHYTDLFLSADPAIIAKHKAEEEEAAKKAAIEAAKNPPRFKLLSNLAKKADRAAGCCSFAIEYANGDVKVHAQAACHASMAGVDEGNKVAFAENIKGHITGMTEDTKKDYIRYVDYILHQSPWRNLFLSRGLNNAIEKGILVNCSRPIEEMAGAVVALRMGSEFSRKLKMFVRLLDKGYSGNVAFLLCYAVEGEKFVGFDDAHKCISGDASYKSLFKFMKEGYTLTKDFKPYTETNVSYEGINRWIAEKGDAKTYLNAFFREGLNVKVGGWDAKSIVKEEDLFKFADALERLVNNY